MKSAIIDVGGGLRGIYAAGIMDYNGSYIDMDYIYGSLSNKDGENPLDYSAIAANPAKFIIVATNALNGDSLL